MPYASLNVVGNQPIALFGLPDTTARHQLGLTLVAEDPYWGPIEATYVRANGTIRQGGLCVLTPVISSGQWQWNATEVPNTANLGRPLYVAMTPMTSGQYGWLSNLGIIPVNCTASVAADTAFGIVAAGQGGAIANGKQVLNARVVAAATTTVAKANSVANSGSTRLQINGADGWFIGIYLSGTGIAAGTVVTDIDPSGTQVLLSAATTAAVNGTVTGTYNNGTVFYNVAHIDRPLAQGQIT
jgi:hypothetical protein